MIRFASAVAVMTAVSFAPIVSAKTVVQGSASGSMTVHGETTPLRYAYAWASDEPSADQTLLLLTNIPVPAWTLTLDPEGPADLCDVAVAGKVEGLEIRFDPQGARKAQVFHYFFIPKSGYACTPLYPEGGDDVRVADVKGDKRSITGIVDAKSSRDDVTAHAEFNARILTSRQPLPPGELSYQEMMHERAAVAQRKMHFLPAKGEGKLMIDDAATPLKFAYAGRGWNPGDPTQRVTYVILAEAPLPESALTASLNDLAHLGQQTKAQGIIVGIDERNQISQSWIMHHAYGESGGSNVMGRVIFTPVRVSPSVLEGKLHDTGAGYSLKESYDASFTATLPHE